MKISIQDYPSIFWKWNDRLTKRTLIRQIHQLHDRGIRSFLIHPMPEDFRKEDFFAGMTTPYLSVAFFKAVRIAVEAAAGLNMQVWLYDEGGWPSGLAGGLILKKWPHLRAQVMTPEGLQPSVPVRTDLMHPETTQRFLEVTHQRYKAAVGEYFGSVIPGFFTDEPDVPGQVGTARLPWTPDLPEEFARRTGRPLEPLLPKLFGRGRDTAAREARIQFAQVWTSLFAERFFDPMGTFCHANGLVLVGHLLGDQSLRAHARCGGDFFKLINHLDEPGIDTVWGQIDARRPNAFFPTFASSALKRVGQRCWSEPFAVYGIGLTVQEMKRLADAQLVQGINKFAPMQVQLSRRDGRWVETATRSLDQAPDADCYPGLDRYLAETGHRLREARLFRPVRVPYPIQELWAQYGRSTSAPFNRLAMELTRRNIGFIFDPEAKETNVEKLTRQFHSAWRFPQKIECSSGIRWVALTTRDGKNFIFCTNGGNRRGAICMKPSACAWEIAPGESRFLSLDNPQPDEILKPLHRLTDWKISAISQWMLQNGVPMPVNIKKPVAKPCRLGSWTRNLGHHFSGTSRYCTTFQWSGTDDVWLDLGRVGFSAVCYLNGTMLGRGAWAPFRYSLKGVLQDANNILEIEVGSSLANLMTDPATKKELKRRGWWNVYLERSSALEATRTNAGLFGPITILG